MSLNTLAPGLRLSAASLSHIPLSDSTQEWADARTHFDLPPIDDPRFASRTRATSSRDPSPARTAPPRTRSIPKLPTKIHKKSPSVPGHITTRKAHNRKPSGLPKSPSVPTFHTHSASADAASTPGTPSARSKSSAQVTRSPSRKKAPASHSSYGIETDLGPPPSYSTQRTLSQDRVWKVDSANRTQLVTDENRLPTSPATETSAEQAPPATRSQPLERPVGRPTAELVSSPETLDTPSIGTPTEQQNATMAPSGPKYGINVREDDPEVTVRGLGVEHIEEDSRASSSDERKSEDLFLNIAKANGAPPTDPVKAERRRSRVSLPFLSGSRQISGHGRGQDSPSHTGSFDLSLLRPRNNAPKYDSKRSSLSYQTAVSAHPLDNSARARYFNVASRNISSVAPSVASGDTRPRSPEEVRSKRQSSNLNSDSGLRSSIPTASLSAGRTQRYVSESVAPKTAAPTATESTISTTAPSTVWDELDDLKSRIKKLELTGKLPSSSAAAMSSLERPRTATTTVTTMSSSPKHNKNNVSTMASTIEGVPSTVHPLLHEALDKARGAVNHDVYQKLQASAQDALQLTSMMGGGAQGSSAAAMGIPPSAERQIRRRADDMCRNLTELAIALSAESMSAVSPTPAVREVSSGFMSRRLSTETPDRPAIASRAQSRYESRRASLRLGESRIGYSSPMEHTLQSPPSVISQPLSASVPRIQRTSTVLRNRRAQGYDGVADEDDSPVPKSISRPVSRAQTDSGASRRLSRGPANFSREYTSQYPLPLPSPGETLSAYRQLPTSSTGYRQFLSRKYRSPGSVMGDDEVNSSAIPATPRDGFTRNSVVGRQGSILQSSPAQSTPENVTVARGSGDSGRRSFGLAGRIGSSVGSRLRAVRAERYTKETEMKEQVDSENQMQELENAVDDRIEA